MHPFTNKELYIMNGGQKHYILKDGFADIYNATPAEERQWKKEIIDNCKAKVAEEVNTTTLQFAIDNLIYHKYEELVPLLVNSIDGTSPERALLFAAALWNLVGSEKDFEIAFQILVQHKAECIKHLFQHPGDFKKHVGARHFLIYCLEGNDEYLFENAQRVLSIWAWSGLPQLRSDHLIDPLQFNNRTWPKSQEAIMRLKKMLTIN